MLADLALVHVDVDLAYAGSAVDVHLDLRGGQTGEKKRVR